MNLVAQVVHSVLPALQAVQTSPTTHPVGLEHLEVTESKVNPVSQAVHFFSAHVLHPNSLTTQSRSQIPDVVFLVVPVLHVVHLLSAAHYKHPGLVNTHDSVVHVGPVLVVVFAAAHVPFPASHSVFYSASVPFTGLQNDLAEVLTTMCLSKHLLQVVSTPSGHVRQAPTLHPLLYLVSN